MKKIYSFLLAALISTSLLGQIPNSFKYQAVLRNLRGEIRAKSSVIIGIDILKGDATGIKVYSENHSVLTDSYGLINLEIGKGTSSVGTFTDIDWSTGSYFIKVIVDGIEMGTNQLLSVPYALYAGKAGNGFSGKYNDLDGKPTLFDGTWLSLSGKPTLSAIATSGSFSDLIVTPTTLGGYGITDAMNTSHPASGISSTNISNWNSAYNWGNHTTLYRPVTWVPSWTDVTGKPNIINSITGTAPVNVTTGSTPVISILQANGTTNGYLSSTDWTTFNNKSTFNGTWASLTGKPTTLIGYGITDAMNISHPANGIASTNITNWDAAFGWGNHTGLYRPVTWVPSWTDITGKPIGNSVGDLQYWSGSAWVLLPRGSTGQVLTMSSLNIPSWQNASSSLLLAPAVVTTAATNVLAFSATINGTVNPNNLNTTIVFEWGTTTSYGNTTIPSQSPVTGSSAVNITANITGLQANTTYHFRIKATNTVDVSSGVDLTFATPLSVPQITTKVISAITTISASGGGNITNNGGSPVTASGVCWNTTGTPDINNNNTNDDIATGAFTSSITGLTENTTYYVRAYATNSVGIAYGNELSFTTNSITLPVIFTEAISYIETQAATSGGTITSDGGSPLTASGVCWNTFGNPDTTFSKTSDGIVTGTFTSNITGLSFGTTYYVRAYACNSLGTAYGDEFVFTTYNFDAITDIDNNYYNIVAINGDVWMGENLRTTSYSNGDIIGTASWDITGESTPKYQWAYDDNEFNVSVYGRLYTWFAATDSRNICPIDWHVPSDAEWTALTDYLTSQNEGNEREIALDLAAMSGWATSSIPLTIGYDMSSNNSTGFTAVPGGYRGSDGMFHYEGYSGYWWAPATGGAAGANSRNMDYSGGGVGKYSNGERNGFSIRCIYDFGNATIN